MHDDVYVDDPKTKSQECHICTNATYESVISELFDERQTQTLQSFLR